MRLYLARHGDAGAPSASGSDRTRPLTELGRAQCSQMSLFLGTSGLVVNRIFHSAYARTGETAEFFARSVSDSLRVEPLEVLGPDLPTAPVLEFVSAADEDLLLVGHFPQLTRVTVKLLGCSPTPFTFETGSVACFEPRGDGSWALGWFIRPDLLGRAELLTRNF